MQFRKFLVLQHNTEWEESDGVSVASNYKLIHGGRNDAYVYNQDGILCCSGIKICVTRSCISKTKMSAQA